MGAPEHPGADRRAPCTGPHPLASDTWALHWSGACADRGNEEVRRERTARPFREAELLEPDSRDLAARDEERICRRVVDGHCGAGHRRERVGRTRAHHHVQPMVQPNTNLPRVIIQARTAVRPYTVQISLDPMLGPLFGTFLTHGAGPPKCWCTHGNAVGSTEGVHNPSPSTPVLNLYSLRGQTCNTQHPACFFLLVPSP